jgi:hypothetical protein
MTWWYCNWFRSNEVGLWLSVIACNFVNRWWPPVLPTAIVVWSLITLQQRLARTGVQLVKRARYYWLLLAQSHLTRRLSGRRTGVD